MEEGHHAEAQHSGNIRASVCLSSGLEFSKRSVKNCFTT